MNKINENLKLLETVIPDTPQQESSKLSFRVVISTLEKSNSETNHSKESDSEKINQAATHNWCKPSKLYYQRSTPPDLLLEEKSLSIKSFSANNIYEWNIDGQTEYQIMNTLQHMTMCATAYSTTHNCSEETIVEILVAGFSGQLKG